MVSKQQIEVNGIPVEVVRKDIKNLYLAVHPPNGRVRVSAPRRTTNETVRLVVISRLGWIRKQQAVLEKQQRQSAREMITGESHFVQGRLYRLNVLEHNAPPVIAIRNDKTLQMRVRPGTNREKRDEVLQQWYRQLLRDQLPGLLDKWQPVIGVEVAQFGIKRMKTRWGTCNIDAKRVWLNLELARKPPACLEYVLVHEMVHLLERHHNDNFRAYMDQFLPQWRTHQDELNQAPLALEQ